MVTQTDIKRIKSEVLFVTPKMAEEWLTRNNEQIEKGEHSNRRVNEHDVARYAADMTSQAWVPNNQGIGFDVENHLIDGQKRLWAIKQSGVGAWLLVVTGLPKQYENGTVIRTMDTVDCGQVRTVRGQWQIEGIAYSTLLASAVRLISLLCNDFVRVKMSMSQMNRVREMYQRQVYGIINNLEKHTQLRGYVVAPLAMYRMMNREKADAFTVQFSVMSNLPIGSPVLAMARYFMANKSKAGTESQKAAMRVVATALYAYDQGDKLQIARPNAAAVEWLLQSNKGNVRKVREILNVERPE